MAATKNTVGKNSSSNNKNNNIPVIGMGRKCLCETVGPPDDTRLPWDYASLCSACCKRSLRSHIERHEQALLERDLARERCAQRLARVQQAQSSATAVSTDGSSSSSTGGHCNFDELQFESQRLRERRAALQKQCASMAVEVAALAVENEERRESLNPQAEIQRQQLQRLDQAICEGSLKQAIERGREQVKILRFQWALKAFAMHRLDVRPEDMVNTTDVPVLPAVGGGQGGSNSQPQRRRSHHAKDGQKKARGIGKIGGLPLPHAGPELYGVLPPQELQSALRLVASISSTVARCLGILLPHPVLLQHNSTSQGDIIHSAVISQRKSANQSQSGADSSPKDVQPADGLDDPTSTESLQAILDASLENLHTGTRTGSSDDGGRRQDLEECANSTVVPPSMDSSLVNERLRHATAAVLAESDPSAGSSSSAPPPSKSSQYSLAADNMNQDEFAIALQFLQNNVIALCIRSGVPVANLWPGEAVLLNLYALQAFCEDQIKQILKK